MGRREAVVDLGIVPQITPATHHDTAVRIDAVIEIKAFSVLSSHLAAYKRYCDLHTLLARVVCRLVVHCLVHFTALA